MISTKKLLKMARKWHKLAATERKRITLLQTIGIAGNSSCSTSLVAEKGHFAVFLADQKRFFLPLEYLNNDIIRKLFRHGRRRVWVTKQGTSHTPVCCRVHGICNWFNQTKGYRDVENAFLMSISCSSLSFYLQDHVGDQLPICSF